MTTVPGATASALGANAVFLTTTVLVGASSVSLIDADHSTANPPKTPSLALPLAAALNLQSAAHKVAVILHLYYLDLITEIVEYLSNIPVPFDLFISTDTREKELAICKSPLAQLAQSIELRIVPNRGRDMAPKLITFVDVIAKYVERLCQPYPKL